MFIRVKRIAVVLVLGGLFSLFLSTDAQSQSHNRLSIRNRHESVEPAQNTTEHLASLVDATSDRQTRKNVSSEILSIPGIRQDDYNRIQTVLNSVSVFRRLPVYKIEVDQSMMMFLVNNPDVVVNIWEKLNISQIAVKKVDENLYSVSDVAGTSGLMKKIWSGNNAVLYYLEGSYKGSLIANRVKGRALILARFVTDTDKNGTENMVCYVDTFLSIEQEFFDAGIKLLFPMFGRVADNNLEQTLIFVQWYSNGCKQTPVSLAAFAMELDDVSYETRQELGKQTYLTAQRNGNSEVAWNVAQPTSRPVQAQSTLPQPAQSVVQPVPYQVNYPSTENDNPSIPSDALTEPEPVQLVPIDNQSNEIGSIETPPAVTGIVPAMKAETDDPISVMVEFDQVDVDIELEEEIPENPTTVTSTTSETIPPALPIVDESY